MRGTWLSGRFLAMAVGVAACGWTAFGAEAQKPARLLVVSVTTGFRHASIGTAEGVLEQLGRSTGLFHCDHLRMPPGRLPQPKAPKRGKDTSDEQWKKQEADFKAQQEKFRHDDEAWQTVLKAEFAKVFSAESLRDFDGVIFLSTTGELPVPDLTAFLDWIKSGKAFIGFHAATDTFKSSDAYCDMIGGHFAGHPWGAGGEHAFVVHEPGHGVAAMFPERFRWKDEIYQYDGRYAPENLRVLVSLDMAASTPKEPWHVPVSWVRDYGKGRVFYTNFGHNEATWKEPMFRRHASDGIAWALGRFDAPAAPNAEAQAAEYLRGVVAAAGGEQVDALRARVDARIAREPGWAVG
ncbi:MAG: ThuA domain-containing protein, partial [Planctomycetaceae bacterium]